MRNLLKPHSIIAVGTHHDVVWPGLSNVTRYMDRKDFEKNLANGEEDGKLNTSVFCNVMYNFPPSKKTFPDLR